MWFSVGPPFREEILLNRFRCDVMVGRFDGQKITGKSKLQLRPRKSIEKCLNPIKILMCIGDT